MDWLVEPFGFAFMRNALVAGLLVVVISSLVGTWVVIRGMTFIGDALAHGVLPGIALAYVAGFGLQLGAALGAAVMVAGVSLVHARARLTQDVGIGLLFVGMLAAGVVIISYGAASFAGDLTDLLFGDPLGITGADLGLAAAAAAVTAVTTVVLYRPFLVLSFSERKAELLGLHPRMAHVAMLGLVALVVVASFRAVGALLVFAFLVAPPATAALVARRVPVMMLAAIALGAVAVVAGLLVSFHAGTAAAATVALVTVIEFFAVLLVREVRHRARRPPVVA